ncbi:MFS transporter [Streptomyces sp. NRRL B-24484]|uniref:MFS transporter n=1 Tax=Streptomyces sp. NRRL B-24484 TaxID=1463833 RepID=UPI003B63DA68
MATTDTDLPAAPAPTAAAPTASVPGLRLKAVLLMAGSCLPILGAVLIAPVLPRIQDHFAATPGAEALVPVALTIPALALALLAPFAGVLIDRLGRHRLLVGATVAYAFVGTAPLWLDSLGAIVASRALVGVAEAVIMTCCTTLIGDYWSGRTRDRYLALQTICAAVSATAFFAIGGAVGSAGWRAPFWAYAVSLLLAPLMATVLRPAPKAVADAPGEPAGPVDTAAERPFPWRRLAPTCGLTLFGAVVFYTVPVETSYLLDDLGVTAPAAIGAATALASAATVAGAAGFARFTGRAQRFLPHVLALCAAGFAVMAVADRAPLLVAGAVVNCLGTGVLLPLLLTRAMALLDHADRGRGTGLWTAAFFLGEFFCPLVLLAASALVGGLAAAVGVLAAATALVALGIHLKDRRPVPATA